MRDPRFYELRDLLQVDMGATMRRLRADKSLLDVRSGLGETLLHWFAIEQREDIVRALAGIGAAIDPTNDFGNTPLLEVASICREDMSRLLLSLGASPDAINYIGDRPLIQAASMGRMKMVRLLLEYGAKIDARGLDDETAVSAAAIAGQIDVLEFFLTRLRSEFDINTLFPDHAADIVHNIGGSVAALLVPRGLRHPFQELMDSIP